MDPTMPQPRPRRHPSGWWYAAAAGLATMGVLAVVWGVGPVARSGLNFSFFRMFHVQRVDWPGETTVEIDKPGPYVVYLQESGPGAATKPSAPPDDAVTLVWSDTEEPIARTDAWPQTLTVNNRAYRAVWKFQADRTGEIIVRGGAPHNGGPDAQALGIAPDIGGFGGIGRAVAGGLLGALLMVAGLAVFVIVLVLRLGSDKPEAEPQTFQTPQT